MIPEKVTDPRPARKQIADPTFRSRRIRELNGCLADCYNAAANANTRKERAFHLEMAEMYRRRILWYLK